MNPAPIAAIVIGISATLPAAEAPCPVTDTGQSAFYDQSRRIDPPGRDDPLSGQDAGYSGNQPRLPRQR